MNRNSSHFATLAAAVFQIEEPTFHFWPTIRQDQTSEFMVDAFNRECRARRCRLWIHTAGAIQYAAVMKKPLRNSIEIYLERCRVTSGRSK